MTRQVIVNITLIAARVITGLLFLCVLLGGYAGYINPSTWAVPSVLCLVFPYLWPVALVVALVWLIFSREKITASVCGVTLLLTLPQILTISPVSFPKGLQSGERPLRVLTYNIAQGQDLEKKGLNYSRSFSYVLHSDADIVCLQECYSLDVLYKWGDISEAQTDSIRAKYPYQTVHKGEDNDYILSRFPIEEEGVESKKNLNYFNYQICRLDVYGKPLTLLNVHLTSYQLNKEERAVASTVKHHPGMMLDEEANAGLYRKLRTAFEVRAEAAEILASIIDTVPGRLIVCGDFNDVPCSYAWRKIKSTGLDDAYVEAGLGPMVTYNAGHLFFHIDQMMYRPDEGMRPLEIQKGKLKSSDHYPVCVTFAIK